MATRSTAIFRSWRLLALLALLVAGALAAPPQATRAATPSTLSGEQLWDDRFFGKVESTCNPEGISTGNFTASGMALGPYPGTFTAEGSYTIAPLPVGANAGFSAGPLLTFEERFTIISGTTTITGTKRLITSFRSVSTGGLCVTFSNKDVQISGLGTFNATGVFNTAEANEDALAYEATIRTDAGTFRDSGRSAVGVADNRATISDPVSGQPTTFVSNFFQEQFLSSQLAPTPLGPATVTLSPPTAVNPVGTSHTVTATVLNILGQPVQGATVLFTVTGADNATGSCTTDANGQCSFTYQGPQLPGADLITACADANKNGTCDPGEPIGTATKVFVLPASTPGQVTGGGQIPGALATRDIAFGFNAQSTDKGLMGRCNVIDQATNTQVKCLDVTALVQTPATVQGGGGATFFGTAEVNGVATTYRIDVTDLAEPGTGKDTFRIQTASGYTAGGVLASGNIQVHRAK